MVSESQKRHFTSRDFSFLTSSSDTLPSVLGHPLQLTPQSPHVSFKQVLHYFGWRAISEQERHASSENNCGDT